MEFLQKPIKEIENHTSLIYLKKALANVWQTMMIIPIQKK
jgi:hypothetical protein